MNETTVRLLWAAAGLLLVSGVIFAFLTLWRYAALMGVGALGCAVAAWNFKNSHSTKR